MLIAFAGTSPAEPVSSADVPPLWSGSAGWQFDPAGVQAPEGIRQLGDLIMEENIRLTRTGIVKETIRMKNARGGELVIPAGAKAFASSFHPVSNDKEAAKPSSLVDWCVLLPAQVDDIENEPASVCIAWQSAQQATYRQDFETGAFAFLPASGVPGVVPKIEEQAVDLGLQLKLQRRLVELEDQTLNVEESISDGAHRTPLAERTFSRMVEEIFVPGASGRAVALRVAADGKSVTARLTAPGEKQRGSFAEYPVVVEVLVGVDGRAKDARLAQSSGLPALDAKVIEHAKTWRLKPAIENGKPVEKWGRFAVKYQWNE